MMMTSKSINGKTIINILKQETLEILKLISTTFFGILLFIGILELGTVDKAYSFELQKRFFEWENASEEILLILLCVYTMITLLKLASFGFSRQLEDVGRVAITVVYLTILYMILKQIIFRFELGFFQSSTIIWGVYRVVFFFREMIVIEIKRNQLYVSVPIKEGYSASYCLDGRIFTIIAEICRKTASIISNFLVRMIVGIGFLTVTVTGFVWKEEMYPVARIVSLLLVISMCVFVGVKKQKTVETYIATRAMAIATIGLTLYLNFMKNAFQLVTLLTMIIGCCVLQLVVDISKQIYGLYLSKKIRDEFMNKTINELEQLSHSKNERSF